MRRDDVVLASRVERRALYFGAGAQALFGWLHRDPAAAHDGRVAVICGPPDHEYTRAHRTMRHLADRLAAAGVPALRFDWHGVGDSPGGECERGRIARWREDARSAIAHAKALTGCGDVCLIGVRLGATLAALVAAEDPIERMVLWNPCVRGRRYLRELQALAQSAARVCTLADGSLESAGYAYAAETIAELRSLDLAQQRILAGRVLLVGRDDLSGDDTLAASLDAQGIAHDDIRVPGWSAMMAEHQFTVVPDRALDAIVTWAAKEWNRAGGTGEGAHARSCRSSIRLPDAPISEETCRFGDGARLFGILARKSADPDRPAVLLFNAGSVHHVGPGRVYVTIARRLAALGFPCLRFDLEGLGDSVGGEGARENHPYPATAPRDARAAIEYLREAHGYSRFIPIGLCSGAHTAFHAALAIEDARIDEAILVNPLTYEYREGMSLESVNQFADARAYGRSMRDASRWRKLLRGEVNVRRLLEVAARHPPTLARSYGNAFLEAVVPSRAPKLARDLRRLSVLGRRMTLFVAEGDPGREILVSGARYTVARALRRGELRIETIAGGDHTFSQSGPRRELVEKLCAHIASAYLSPRPPHDGSEPWK
ncbi:MAG TPA: alpha/beta fold hydrolase [Usitatibacter sp.]|nr:alpha/beta fold hydrolase [Usitatibacter sp.]